MGIKINKKTVLEKTKDAGRIEGIRFAVFGVWPEDWGLEETWKEYPNLTKESVVNMTEKEYTDLVEFVLKPENELYF